jgi:hypothetical protein
MVVIVSLYHNLKQSYWKAPLKWNNYVN